MMSRTAKFDAAIKQSHRVVSKVEVLQSNVVVRELQVSDGNLTIQDEAIRRRCTLTLQDYDGTITPAQASDLFAPYGTEVKLYRGIDFRDGTDPELIPLGVFGLSDVKTMDGGEAVSISIDGYDRARKVSVARMTTEYSVTGNVKTAIGSLLQARYPSIEFSATWNSFTTTATMTSVVLSTGDDPWQFAQKVALEALACDLYFDGDGKLTITPVTDPSLAATEWTYAEGVDAMILSVSKRINNDNSYNHVVVTGEHPELAAPVRGEAKDNNPASPTYYLGNYGDVPVFFTSSFITTTGQANAAALARLNKELGATEDVGLNAIVHPAHEVGDAIAIVRTKSKINAVYIISKLTLPLTPDRSMYISTKSRKL